MAFELKIGLFQGKIAVFSTFFDFSRVFEEGKSASERFFEAPRKTDPMRGFFSTFLRWPPKVDNHSIED